MNTIAPVIATSVGPACMVLHPLPPSFAICIALAGSVGNTASYIVLIIADLSTWYGAAYFCFWGSSGESIQNL